MPDVRALLIALDNAKKQRVNNDELRGALLEAEEYVQRLHSNTFIERLRSDLREAHAEAMGCLNNFEKGLSFAALRRSPDMICEPPRKELHTRALTQPLTNLGGIESDEVAEMRTCLERAISRAENTVDVTPWAPAVKAVIDAFRESSTTSFPVDPRMGGAQAEAAALRGQLAELRKNHVGHLEDGNIEGAMEGYGAIIEKTGHIQQVLQQQLDILAAFRITAVEDKRQNLHTLEAMCQQDLSDFVKAHKGEQSRLKGQVQRLRTEWEESSTVQRRAAIAFVEEGELTRRSLAANEEAQERQWIIMARAEASLHILHKDRSTTVTRWALSCEREARRTADDWAAGIGTATGMSSAGDAFAHCTRVHEVSELLERVVQIGLKLVGDSVEHTNKGIGKALVGVHTEYLENYRVMRLALGDLKHKTDRLADEVAARVANVTAQQEYYMESLDPRAKKYSTERSQHVKQLESLMAKSKALEEQINRNRKAFSSTERVLMTSGNHFVDPEEEVRELDKKRKEHIAEYNEMEHVAAVEGRVVAASRKAPRRIIM